MGKGNNHNEGNRNNGNRGQNTAANGNPKTLTKEQEKALKEKEKEEKKAAEKAAKEAEKAKKEAEKAAKEAAKKAAKEAKSAEAQTAEEGDEEPKEKKEKKGLFEGIFKGFGYVPNKKVTVGLTELAEVLNIDMKSEEFEQYPLKQKLDILKEAIEKLKPAAAPAPAAAASEASKPEATEQKPEDVADEAIGANTPAEGEAKDNEEATSLEIDVETFGKDNLTSSPYTQSFVNKLNERILELEKENKELQQKHSQASDLSASIAVNEAALKAKDDIIARKESSLKNKDEVIKEREEIIQQLEQSKQDFKEQVLDLTIKHNGLKTNVEKLSKDCENYKTQLAELQKENEALRGSDAGQLKEKVEELNSELDEKKSEILKLSGEITALSDGKTRVETELQKTKNKLETTQGNLDAEIDKVKERDTTIGSLTRNNAALNKELEKTNKKVEDQSKQISEKDSTINTLTSEKKSLIQDKTSLQSQVGALTVDKNKLTEEKAKVDKENQEKADFIKSEVEAFAEKFTDKVNKLAEAATEDFLLSRDPEYMNKLPRHQEKVSSPLKALARAIQNINPAEYKTRQELEDAYHEKIMSQLEELTGLTRIAQWYAYSSVPFMIDKGRLDGIVVNRNQIKKLYNLATEILAMVGARYVMPSLYVESINDDDTFENVTGQRQSNIEFMCSTARDHKSSIDRSDADTVIIDVLEIGYADNKGNHKNAQVII